MKQSPSWEANRFSASQEIPRILWKPTRHFLIHKSPPPVPNLSQINHVHVPIPLLKIHFNIIFPFTPRYSKRSLPPQVSLPILSLFIVCTFPPNILISSAQNTSWYVPFNFKPSWFTWTPLMAYSTANSNLPRYNKSCYKEKQETMYTSDCSISAILLPTIQLLYGHSAYIRRAVNMT